ncbi:NAD(P)-dependent oxidoreductase [Paractinoplanes toevensis]|nr:NAD(P)H-binding protein [Actinoplanes toevensis]
MPTSIAVFGAGGRAGRPIVAEAAARGHRVVAVVRDPARHPGLATPNVSVVAGDARDPASAREAAADCAAVVSAVTPFTAPPPSFDGFDTAWYARVADALLAAKPPRLIVVGLFATLRTRPDGPRVLDDPALFPPSLRPFALAHAAGLQRLTESDADWLLLAPPPGLSAEAPPTGTYRLGDDTAEDQDTPLAYADLARAVLDQIDHPTRHRRQTAVHAAAPDHPIAPA